MDHCKKIIWFDEVTSTNTILLADKESMSSGTIYSALHQSAGKGQKGNRWDTHRGENLTFSLLYKPDNLPSLRQFVLSQASAVSVAQYLELFGLKPMIKWPNDILVGGRKICGMLLENSISGGNISSSVIGIGVNINQREFPEPLSRATSVALETGLQLDIRQEIEKLSDILLENLAPENEESVRGRYFERLFQKGEWHEYVDRSACDALIPTTESVDGVRFTGRIKDVLGNGCIVIETSSGDKTFAFKQLSYILG